MCVYLGVIPVHSFTKHKPLSVPHRPVQFPSSRVFESSDTHVSLEVVGSHRQHTKQRSSSEEKALSVHRPSFALFNRIRTSRCVFADKTNRSTTERKRICSEECDCQRRLAVVFASKAYCIIA